MMLDVLSIGSKIIDKIFPDPIDNNKAKALLLEQEQKGELEQIKAQMEVLTAEIKGESPLQRNWRPITMLTFVALLVAKWLGYTAPGISEGQELELMAIIKVGLGGYVMGRSGEKIMNAWRTK